jgi:hypothetical protein
MERFAPSTERSHLRNQLLPTRYLSLQVLSLTERSVRCTYKMYMKLCSEREMQSSSITSYPSYFKYVFVVFLVVFIELLRTMKIHHKHSYVRLQKKHTVLRYEHNIQFMYADSLRGSPIPNGLPYTIYQNLYRSKYSHCCTDIQFIAQSVRNGPRRAEFTATGDLNLWILYSPARLGWTVGSPPSSPTGSEAGNCGGFSNFKWAGAEVSPGRIDFIESESLNCHCIIYDAWAKRY